MNNIEGVGSPLALDILKTIAEPIVWFMPWVPIILIVIFLIVGINQFCGYRRKLK